MANIHRRDFLKKIGGAGAAAAVLPRSLQRPAAADAGSQARPNVILVLTDDQGYGDLSCLGNPILKTSNIDRLHGQSVRLTDFHVCPMCTPTRSQLMTGIHCLQNGAYIVCSGHGFIRRDIPTAADIFADNGYKTGLFGKWHLGDNYPYRPQDRGFQETVTFRQWGIVSAQSYWDSDYFDDKYIHNGKLEQYKGYCTDVFFDEAMKWMRSCAEKKEPFFCYLPTNTPHGPLWVPEKYAQPYQGKVGPGVANFFGMIANIDDNMDRLDKMLKETGLYDNTILIFMTDNGGTTGVKTYNAGMRGRKTEYYDGGHRVPCFIRWPGGGLRKPGDVDDLAQNQDILPTLIDLCGLRNPRGARFDGVSLAPLLRGKS
ncbi:arylsulfatase, partial [Candidatus Sumerlaeota bacterium]|nr:arylsulfatase [Candidatus Sumerlaeota bacterium]